MSRRSTHPTVRPVGRKSSRATRLLGALALLAAPLVLVLIMGADTVTAVRSLTFGYAAVVMGLMVELLWLAGDPRPVATWSLVALGMSLLGYLPFKGEDPYSYQTHLDTWPLFFAGSLLLVMVGVYRKKLVARIGEGSTLLHSIVFFYWMLDVSALPFVLFLAAVPLTFAALHAWTEIRLSSAMKLALSLWSSMVMLALAIQTAFLVVGAGSVEAFLAAHDLGGGVLAFAGYFMLGSAAGYMATNASLLIGYLPARGQALNRTYFREVRALSQEHVARFSSRQVTRTQATVVAAAVVAFLATHWWLRMFPTSVAIGLVLTVVPWTMNAWVSWNARRLAATSPKWIASG